MPLLALVVDLGLSRAASGQARAAADAAALAAALAAVSHPDAAGVATAVAAAHSMAADDFGVPDDQWTSCVDAQPLPPGTAPSPGNCVSFDFATKRVRVTLPAKKVPSVFSGIFDSRPPAASATSTATWGAFRTCVLCVLGSYDGGAQQLEVHGGDVAVGGDLAVPAGAKLLTDAGEPSRSPANRRRQRPDRTPARGNLRPTPSRPSSRRWPHCPKRRRPPRQAVAGPRRLQSRDLPGHQPLLGPLQSRYLSGRQLVHLVRSGGVRADRRPAAAAPIARPSRCTRGATGWSST